MVVGVNASLTWEAEGLKIKTYRFGELDVTAEDLLDFPEGLVGLSEFKRFVLLRDPQNNEVYWLQSADTADFALAALHSSKVQGDYQVNVDPRELAVLHLEQISEAEVFLILNRVEGQYFVNLRGPIIINPQRMMGKQVVLNETRYAVRHPLEPTPVPASSPAPAT